jgi:hypothetical protein
MYTILLSGKQGSGKTTLAAAVEKRFRAAGLGLVRHRFASPVYTAHDAVYAVLRPLGIVSDTAKDGDLLQLIGTDWGRKKDPDIWVKAARAHVAQLEEHVRGTSVILVSLIEDARFENEFDGFPEALRVRLECPEIVRRARTTSWRENTAHESEVGLDEYAKEARFDLMLRTDTGLVEDAAEERPDLGEVGLDAFAIEVLLV